MSLVAPAVAHAELPAHVNRFGREIYQRVYN